MQLLSMDNASLGAKEALFFSFLSRLSQPQEEYFFQEIKIKDLVQECCDFMAEKARLGKNRIDYSGVQHIDPVPGQK